MRKEKEKLSKGAASGMVALVFLVLGFQLAIFVVKVVERPPRAEDAWSEPGMTAGSELGRTEEPGVAGKSGSGSVGDADLLGQSKSEVDGDADLSGRSKLGGYRRPAGGTRASGVKKPGRTWPFDARKPGRTYESFAFDPNTVSVADLQRLGLSERQAESIENYRSKGGTRLNSSHQI